MVMIRVLLCNNIDANLIYILLLQVGRRALMIWPSQRLDASSRYIVALRNLRNKQGTLVSASSAFTSLR